MSNSACFHILCKIRSRHFSRTLHVFLKALLLTSSSFWRAVRLVWTYMQRTLAPLRRIVSRSLEVLENQQRELFPPAFGPTIPFAIIDLLECGHESISLLWDFRDLIDAYTKNPEVKARHHRCRPCLKLQNKRKQPQSVKAIARAVSA